MSWYENAEVPWTYVSPRLIPARLIPFWIFIGLITVGGAIAALTSGLAALIAIPVAALALGAWGTWVIRRQVTAHAWAEGSEDLMVKKGRMFRSVTVVPYGRMQFVDVKAGPIDRAFGIATLQLHTASPASDASISGVPAEEAARLRDRLTTRGEARLAGL
ncbi:PH domain-containing protein [Demequina sp. SYSU T00068]|uniref:PH domain-containing protein n=1 Tax=Demequina lignilytica TaxID=3051663 RepID=UPI0026092D1B|nr:PH domain-containing protein [Demequina sp. SYSU T00068]MDN4490621.1 PH domain-containing protein [Demequina sp. SYSU T00068]